MGAKRLIACLMGPTASGKTRTAIKLAQYLPCEIISVDSAMVYRGMDIGTAKPSPEELAQVPHHLIDIRDPKERYSAADFRRDALNAISDIFTRGNFPLLVGGTMLYFKALQEGLSVLPSADAKVREALLQQASRIGWPAMHEQLSAVDPVTAKHIHPHDAQRIQRALEIFELTGKAMSDLQAMSKPTAFPYPVVNLAIIPSDRLKLQDRIENRFDEMLQQGFVEEVHILFERGDLHRDLPSIRSVGYRQVWDYLDGRITFDEMRELAIIATRQLAKRQLTWLRSWQKLHRIDMIIQIE